MPPPDSEQFRWFKDHLQPYEPMLRGWLRTRFATAQDLDDVVQEAYLRVLQAREATEIESPKAFLFATARNIMLGRLRRHRVTGETSLAENDELLILDESVDVAQAVERAQELEMLTLAIQSLPARCRQVITLRKIYGMSQKEVAAKLGISEHTVEAQTMIGLRKLTVFFERLDRQKRSSP